MAPSLWELSAKLTEGVYFVEWYNLIILYFPRRGRQLGDPLRRSRPETDGSEQFVTWNQLPQLPLGFPRGEAARLDGTSEPARLTDEGRRQVGSGMQLDEWHMFWFPPLNREIYNF